MLKNDQSLLMHTPPETGVIKQF